HVNEGASYSLTLGAITDPGTDTVSSYVVHWGDGSSSSFTGNASGQTATHAYADGPNSYSITVDLTDEDGSYNNVGSPVSVTIVNVAPTAVFGNNGPKPEHQPVTFTFSSQFDASNVDQAAGFKYSFDWNNDGIFEVVDSTSATATHAFQHDGTYTIRGRIKDKDGGTTDYTTSAVVTNIDRVAVGADAGGAPQIKVYDSNSGNLLSNFYAYGPGFTGG